MVKRTGGLKFNLKLLSSVLIAVALGLGAVVVPWALQPGGIAYKEPLRMGVEQMPEPVPAPLQASPSPVPPPPPTLPPFLAPLLPPLLGGLIGFVAAFLARKRLRA